MDKREKIPELETLERIIIGKVRRIMDETNSMEEIEGLKPLMNELRDLQYRHKRIRIRAVDRPHSKPPIEDIERTRIDLCSLMKRVKDFEEMFLKYNVPRLGGSESLESRIDLFMRVWRDEAERRRGKGEKSLIEWIRKLDQTASEEMRLVMVDLGTHISYKLGTYFMLVAAAVEIEEVKRKILEVEIVIRGLAVEGDSVVIDGFGKVMIHVRTVVLNLAATFKRNGDSGSNNKWFELAESGILSLILKEVLRFEVAFSCPDLPMMWTNEMFVGMSNLLRYRFEKKLNVVSFEVDNLATRLQNSIAEENRNRVKVARESLDSGILRVWDELDFNPRV